MAKSCNTAAAEIVFESMSKKELKKALKKAGLSDFDVNTTFDFSNFTRKEKQKFCRVVIK